MDVSLHDTKTEPRKIRLTKTLLVVSIVALLSWLSVNTVQSVKLGNKAPRHRGVYKLVRFLCFSNSFGNPVLYALRIPD